MAKLRAGLQHAAAILKYATTVLKQERLVKAYFDSGNHALGHDGQGWQMDDTPWPVDFVTQLANVHW